VREDAFWSMSLDILNVLRNVETIVDLQEISRAMVVLNK
jgi:hypothetical protein